MLRKGRIQNKNAQLNHKRQEMIKESFLQEDITILYIYMPNNRTWKYVRQKTDRPAREKQMNPPQYLEISTPSIRSA